MMHLLTMAASKDTRVLVASRHLTDIDTGLGHRLEFEVCAVDSDLSAYVSNRLATLEKRMPSAIGLKQQVIDKVVADADGM